MQTPEDDALGALIRREAVRYAPPEGLADRVRQDLHRTADAHAPRRLRRAPWTWRWPQALALFGAGAATAWGLALALLVAPVQNTMVDAITDSHVRSLMGTHLADVQSSDRHTVKPWFAGKLDFSPPVIDLAAEGMPLTGARLDYIDGRPVAALVYRAGPHVINLFVWPAQPAQTAPVQWLARRGYNLAHWTEGGMQAWAVSDVNAAELRTFSTLVQERMAATETR